MATLKQEPCAVLKVGIWDGSNTCERGKLLYRVLLRDALRFGLRGGTTSGSVEGSHSSRVFRTVESEVSSNELPVSLEFVDCIDRLERWIPSCKARVQNQGVIVVERGHVWGRPVMADEARKGGTGMEGRQPGGEFVTPSADAAYDGLQVQVYTLERNTLTGKPVYQAVAEFLRNRGIMWVSTMRGVAGFGDERRIHQAHWVFRRNDVPVVTTALDRAEKLDKCLSDLVAFVGESAFVVSKPVIWHHPL